ncbi:pumilio homolog 2-like isoform X2 [Haliotis rufescens]|uniref:pumilio homolog 2-like isoform X2 n=1 Tax=Haliotis rufescens TaxID=6454 RepID=UPI00201EE038|nr:pumilio homolog 2-like isoform X2 [Haliotis rufescens]
MPVSSMNEVSWNDSQGMLTNSREMAGIRQNQGPGSRSQDDAMVGYFFQRPQSDTELMGGYTNKRWAVGDDSVIEQARGMQVQDLERDFHGLTLSREINPSKKIWEVGEEGHKGGDGGKSGIFTGHHPWTTRDDTWSGPETSALGVNMVEYVLGGSPTGKDMEGRMRMKGTFVSRFQNTPVAAQDPSIVEASTEKKSKTPSPFEDDGGDRGEENKDMQQNGILQNGLDDGQGFRGGSRQTSPTGDEGKVPPPQLQLDPSKMQLKPDGDFLDQQPSLVVHQQGFQLDTPQFEPVGIDPGQFDYSSQLMPSMDSPNFNMDYNQLLQRQQQQQQPIAVLTQQQYALATQQQQLGLAPTAIAPPPYVLSAQDPYTVGIPIAGPTVIHPQYYGVQTPWGIYPANLIQQPQGQQTPQGMQQQQTQMMPRQSNGRPLTPSQQNDGMGTPQTLQAQPLQAPNMTVADAGYQILAPAYYDQNGQLVMGNPRGIGTPVRLVSPAPVLVSANANQQGGNSSMGNNTLRLLTTQPQQVQTPPVVLSSSNSNSQQQSSSLGYTPSSSLGYTQVTTSLFTPIAANLSLNPQQQTSYSSNGLASLGSSTPGAIGSGQRRESFDVKRQQLPVGGYYSQLSGMASPAGPGGLMQPGQSMTPPPSLSGSTSNLTLGSWDNCGLGGSGRPYSAAPGAEAKYRAGLISPANGLFGNSTLFQNRNFASRSASLSKEVTGRSRLLEDFRNNRIPNLQLKDLVNHVVEFSQDQHGSRFIQQKLERATHQEKAMVFGEILTAAYSLMTDVFGNYVIQKFFEFGSSDQKQTLAQRVRGHVLPLALQMYGCRVIQKALESIPADMQVEIVKELDGHVLKCVKDQNGNHVVQKCIECVDPKHLQFIIDAFKGQVFTLSTHPYGCRVIQRILEHCMPEQTMPILEELHEHTERLVQDQYGNYVIQHVLEHGRPEDKSKIVTMIRGKVLLLSQHKFASNVVEKCVSHSSRQEKAFLIEEVCSINDGALYTMMKDQFANYVVQKMIDVAEPPQRKILMHKIRPHIGTLRKYTYGKHILAKLEKFFLKNNSDLGPIGMPPNGALP